MDGGTPAGFGQTGKGSLQSYNIRGPVVGTNIKDDHPANIQTIGDY